MQSSMCSRCRRRRSAVASVQHALHPSLIHPSLTMIDGHYWPTPNGHKITIFLEETGTPYRIVPVNIGAGDQFKPDFLKISPNNRMPAIVDTGPTDGGESVSIFESGAILVYLAEKIGKFLSKELRGRFEGLQWPFCKIGRVGPMAGTHPTLPPVASEQL